MDATIISQLPSPRLRDWYAQCHYFAFGPHRIVYRRSDNWDASSSPVLVMMHGFPTSSFDWIEIWSALSQNFRLLAPDLLGFGLSSKPRPHNYTIKEQADAIEALLALNQVDEWHLLAHDYGDSVAQELLARHNERPAAPHLSRLRSVALLNGGLFPETHRPRLIQKLLLSALGPWLAERLNRKRFGRSFRAVFSDQHQPTDAALDEFWALIAQADGHLLAPQLLRYIPERRQYRQRWVGALSESTIPLRLINGLADPVSGAHMVARYRELITTPDIVELPGIGHYPQIEAPERVVQAVRDQKL